MNRTFIYCGFGVTIGKMEFEGTTQAFKATAKTESSSRMYRIELYGPTAEAVENEIKDAIDDFYQPEKAT